MTDQVLGGVLYARVTTDLGVVCVHGGYTYAHTRMASDRLVLHLEHAPASPGVARAAVREYAADHGLTRPVREAALLVASELVSNAVLHGAAPITLSLERLDDGALRVEVCDASDGMEPTQVHSGDWATTGRGLAIVAALAREWRVERRAEGKSVAAEISVR